MTTHYNDLHLISPTTLYGRITETSTDMWQLAPCPYCSGHQMAVIAKTHDDLSYWLRCVNCARPLVRHGQMLSPGVKPLSVPMGLPQVDSRAWDEVRECLAVGACTAAVMMCRKILLHVAVAYGLPAKNDKDKAPTFMEAVNHLELEGVITKPMLRWVNRIKDVGNEANHEIRPVDSSAAMDVATFTEQLLRLAYEMDALIEEQNPDTGE